NRRVGAAGASRIGDFSFFLELRNRESCGARCIGCGDEGGSSMALLSDGVAVVVVCVGLDRASAGDRAASFARGWRLTAGLLQKNRQDIALAPIKGCAVGNFVFNYCYVQKWVQNSGCFWCVASLTALVGVL